MAAVALLMISGGIMSTLSATVAEESTSAAALFPPWWSPARAFEAAALTGEIARLGATSAILIVHSEQPALSARLKAAGALLVFDPKQLALCQESPSEGISRE